MQVGTAERLFGEGLGFCKLGTSLGAKITIQSYQSHVHVFQMFAFCSGAVKAVEHAGEWIKDLFNNRNLGDENFYTMFDFNGQFTAQQLLESPSP